VRKLAFFAVSAIAVAQTWTPQKSGTAASLRGIAAVNDRVAWASGAGGTYLITTNGGMTWTASQVPGAESLDFRDVHATDERTAWLLASGPGDKSRIYHTTDGGHGWTLQFTNPDATGFLDAIAFRGRRGLALGDPVDGHFVILATNDGGEHWTRREGPAALPGEGAFAASGTGLVFSSGEDVWFGTGRARVFHSTDGGMTWTVRHTTMRQDGRGAGIFSLAFSDAGRGVAVGGDYTKPDSDEGNAAITDIVHGWTGEPSRPSGFRSAVEYVPSLRAFIAVGTSGSDISTDDGLTWKRFDSNAYNAISFPFAVGPKGAIARYSAK
jgi:photosystem II stability/assembly factor-like uncharacterized protein